MEELTSEKIKTSEKLCKTCKYGITFGAGYYCCDYLHKRGARRGCSVGECDKYERRGRKKCG